jgi:hypothetical protein
MGKRPDLRINHSMHYMRPCSHSPLLTTLPVLLPVATICALLQPLRPALRNRLASPGDTPKEQMTFRLLLFKCALPMRFTRGDQEYGVRKKPCRLGYGVAEFLK